MSKEEIELERRSGEVRIGWNGKDGPYILGGLRTRDG